VGLLPPDDLPSSSKGYKEVDDVVIPEDDVDDVIVIDD